MHSGHFTRPWEKAHLLSFIQLWLWQTADKNSPLIWRMILKKALREQTTQPAELSAVTPSDIHLVHFQSLVYWAEYSLSRSSQNLVNRILVGPNPNMKALPKGKQTHYVPFKDNDIHRKSNALQSPQWKNVRWEKCWFHW